MTLTRAPLDGSMSIAGNEESMTTNHKELAEYRAPAPTALAPTQPLALRPSTLKEALQLADLLARSSFVPKDFRGKAGDVFAAIQMGMELGLAPMQSLQNIAVINGRPSLWGDTFFAVVRAHPQCSEINETIRGDGDNRAAFCDVLRRGSKPVCRSFSVADAKRANLWGKPGPWTQYPDRMLQMRARSFACRDAFPDALRGLSLAEESADLPPERETPRAPELGRPAPLLAEPPSADAPPSDVERALGLIADASTMEQLEATATVLKGLALGDARSRVVAAYRARVSAIEALSAAAEPAEPEHDPQTGEVTEDPAHDYGPPALSDEQQQELKDAGF